MLGLLRRDGSRSCQLVFARSKIVPRDISGTRVMLLVAQVNAYGEVGIWGCA